MATSLLTLLDDIATILDDVAVMTKVATKKTAGVLGDDLALNAQQVSGVRADRELPVVFAVAKGSMVNKAILVPVALLISTFAPWAITPLLMIGGLYLCFEGVEKLAHKYLHPADANAEKTQLLESVADESIDLVAMEKSKIKGAIRTDFILSAEIIVISLGTIAAASFGVRVASLIVISLIMTVGVYGLVAGIVKLDDAGLYLSKSSGASAWTQFKRMSGRAVLWFAPWLMKTLSVVGTAAMFIVGGGILTHGVHWIAERIESTASVATAIPGVGRFIESITTMLLDSLVGLLAGAVVLGVVSLFSRFRAGESNAAAH